jgi:hypothetical protein
MQKADALKMTPEDRRQLASWAVCLRQSGVIFSSQPDKAVGRALDWHPAGLRPPELGSGDCWIPASLQAGIAWNADW